MPKTTKHLAKYQFKKGGPSGNPKGRLPNPALRALKSLTIETYREVIEIVLTGNLAKLDEMIEDPKTSAVQVGVAKSFQKAINSGDYGVIERIAERIVGKIPDEVRINNNTNLKLGTLDRLKLKDALAELESDV